MGLHVSASTRLRLGAFEHSEHHRGTPEMPTIGRATPQACCLALTGFHQNAAAAAAQSSAVSAAFNRQINPRRHRRSMSGMKRTQRLADNPASDSGGRGEVQRAALAYVARGWSVVPIEPRGKRPLLAWRDLQQRIAETAEIEAWYQRWPDANVGIVTGQVSGLVVVDVDPRHGGQDSLAQIEHEHGPLPRTAEVATGGGGRHLYFGHPGGTLHNRVGLRPGLDVRGDGGCVVAPPSVHPSGQRYAWRIAPQDARLADLPARLLDPTLPGGRPNHSLAHWRQLVREGVDEGARNATLASLTGHLLWHQVDAAVALELLLAWNRMRCRPPLPDDEVARVVQSIARLHEREGDTPAAG
jgi:Bifunctional DNA primase/polymerase, N-terminal/Primase C terminal 1 (PriCT-1)